MSYKSYQECLRMRYNRKIAQSTNKSLAVKGYDDDIDAAIAKKVDSICNTYGLEERSSRELIRILLMEGISKAEISRRIEYIYDVLENYLYAQNKTRILESNKSLLTHTTLDLMHTLAITSSYGLDNRILITPTIYSRIDDKTMYALIEELRELGLDVTFENIEHLYVYSIKEDLLHSLKKAHPLTKKVIFSYVFTNDKVLSKSKGVK